MSLGNPDCQNCLEFVLVLLVQFSQKVHDRSSPFFSAGGRPTSVDNCCEIGLRSPDPQGMLPQEHILTFPTKSSCYFVMHRLHSFDLLYSCRLVLDLLRIVELLQICYGFVVQLAVELL